MYLQYTVSESGCERSESDGNCEGLKDGQVLVVFEVPWGNKVPKGSRFAGYDDKDFVYIRQGYAGIQYNDEFLFGRVHINGLFGDIAFTNIRDNSDRVFQGSEWTGDVQNPPVLKVVFMICDML